VRAFLACRIDTADATRLNAALEPFRQVYTGRGFRWTPPANYHVTLRFFGELSQTAVERVWRLVEPILSNVSPIDCRATAPRPLPNARHPRVLVVPIDSDGRLERLATQCNDALGKEFGPPDKTFRAHLTVIRVGTGARLIESAQHLIVPLALTSVAVFESTQLDGGPRYTSLRDLRLGR